MRVNISARIIFKFLYKPYYQPPMNMGDIEYHMDEMQKITKKQMWTYDKMGHFRWISYFIAENGQNVVWVESGTGVTSQKIEKNTLNFKDKA